jgi:hypothetical protein
VSFPLGLRPRPLDFVSPLVSLRDSSVLERFCSGGGEGEGSVGVAGRFAPRALPRATGFSGCGAGAGLGAAAVRADLRTFSIVVASLVGGWWDFRWGRKNGNTALPKTRSRVHMTVGSSTSLALCHMTGIIKESLFWTIALAFVSTNGICSAGTDLHQLNYGRLASSASQALYSDANEVENSLLRWTF